MTSTPKLTLMVLAAGMGSRYGGIKQIDGFGPNGETIMDYSLYDAIRAGFNKVVFIVREEIKETVQDLFLPKLKDHVEVEFVVQSIEKLIPKEYFNINRIKPWGTGHAMLCAQDYIQEPFAVINADDFYGQKAFKTLADFFGGYHQGTHAMVGYTLKNVLSKFGSVSRGCGETDSDGFLRSVVECTDIVTENGQIIARDQDEKIILSPETPTSMNFWGFQPSIFEFADKMFQEFVSKNHENIKSEFFIPLFVNEMIRLDIGKVAVLDGGETWFGVTYQEDKDRVAQKIDALIQDNVYPNQLWKTK